MNARVEREAYIPHAPQLDGFLGAPAARTVNAALTDSKASGQHDFRNLQLQQFRSEIASGKLDNIAGLTPTIMQQLNPAEMTKLSQVLTAESKGDPNSPAGLKLAELDTVSSGLSGQQGGAAGNRQAAALHGPESGVGGSVHAKKADHYQTPRMA